MNRILTTTAAVLATAGLAVAGASTAGAAGSAAKPSAADVAFLRANQQVNLAEVALGGIAMNRTDALYVVRLGRMTVSDHRKASRANMSVAKTLGVTLPTTPSKLQLAQGASEAKVARPAHHYFALQVKGHRISIAATKAEIAGGTSTAVINYAKYYLPIAEMHLVMARADLARYNRTH